MTEYVYNYKKHGILKKCPYPENFCDGTPIPATRSRGRWPTENRRASITWTANAQWQASETSEK